MRVVYGDWWSNVGFAALVLLLGGAFEVGAWSGTGEQGPVIGWLGVVTASVFVVLLAVRSLRRRVVVDDDGVTDHDIFSTTFVPWNAITEVEFRNSRCAHFVVDDGRRIRVDAPPCHGRPSLEDAYAQVRTRWSDEMGDGFTYPGPRGRAVSIGYIVAACVLVLGAVVWDDAQFDADRYAARERRDREGTVSVMRAHVDEQDHGEGGLTYTTHVIGWLRVPGHSSVRVELHRAGDLARNFHAEDRVPVVYDAANRHDVDFADRPNRRGDRDSAALRSVTGPVLFWVGLLGVVACGLAIARESLRRVPARRRTWLMPR
jgi:hypothetical protein